MASDVNTYNGRQETLGYFTNCDWIWELKITSAAEISSAASARFLLKDNEVFTVWCSPQQPCLFLKTSMLGTVVFKNIFKESANNEWVYWETIVLKAVGNLIFMTLINEWLVVINTDTNKIEHVFYYSTSSLLKIYLNNIYLPQTTSSSVSLTFCDLNTFESCRFFSPLEINSTFYTLSPDLTNYYSVGPYTGNMSVDTYVVSVNTSYKGANLTGNTQTINTGFLTATGEQTFLVPLEIKSLEVKGPCTSAEYMDVTYSLISNASFLHI